MKEYIITVKGMICEMCENHINDAVRACAKVKSVKSDRKKQQTLIVAENLDVEKIISVIRGLGYEADGSFAEYPYPKRKLFDRFRRQISRNSRG